MQENILNILKLILSIYSVSLDNSYKLPKAHIPIISTVST